VPDKVPVSASTVAQDGRLMALKLRQVLDLEGQRVAIGITGAGGEVIGAGGL